MRRATAVNRQHSRLSVPDAFAFAIAERIDMHGVLWPFDQLADGNHVAFDRLHGGLSSLFALLDVDCQRTKCDADWRALLDDTRGQS